MQSESNEPDINQAWHQKRYDVILSLIKEDSDFPENFATTDLDENVEDQCNLLRFVEERRSFHRSIEEGDLENVKTFPFNEGSALYLNEVNHSALYTAVVNKRFEIYAFLRSVGADFRNDEERNVFDELTGPEKNSLTDALVPYLFQSSKAHIYYLISKSRAQKPVNNLEGIVRDYYEKLEQIPEVSIIFKIIHYADFLDIVFDFDNDNVAYLSATASKETKGDTNYKTGRIFIAAGRNRKPNEILGTIAHELTHMAMQIIYENDCDPYYKSEALGFEKVRDFCKKFSNSHEPISKVLSETFSSYGIKDYDSELIARVPHILAQFSDNNTGETWLTEEGTDLWNYFKEKVIVDCEKFIKESSVIKSKNQIRLLNESVGEIKRVENCQLFFNDVTQIQNRLETRKSNVFLFGGKSTWLTALKALQALYGKTYLNKYDSFLVVKFEICKKQPLRIMQECYKEGCDVLIIENIGNLVNQSHFECLDLISELLPKPNKRVVFTVKEEEMLGVEKELKEMNLSVFCFSDRSPTLLDLDDESQRKILDQAVYFQGKRIFLKNLLKGNHELKDIIDFDVIEKITKSEKIEIGSKWSGMASVDGAYGEVLEEINAESFMEEVEMSNKIFLIDGLKEADRVEELLSCVQRKLESETSERKNSNLEKLRDILNNYSKRIVFVENFGEKQFKEFCEENANREIYWVKTNKSLLILQSLYNINFYLGRTFAFYSKLIISKEALIERLKQCTILISHSDRDSFVDLFEFHGYEKRENFMKTIDSSNVRFFESDEIAEIEYESLIENVDSESKPIYWLKKEEDQLIWKNCNAPFQDVKNCIDRNASQKSSATERDLLEKIIHDQVFIIADDPGMGKTTTLTKLCETKFNSQAMMNSHWIIKISFQDQLQAIRNIDVENLCINEIITLISETNANLKTNFAKNLLRCAMDPKYKGIKPLLLTFDGFDQLIEDEDRSIVISLLKFLRKETRSKIWITTRLQFKEILENNLFTFATDFEPIEDSGKEEFITKFFKNRLKLISSPKRMTEIFESVQGSETLPEIAHYAKNFIKHMHGIFQQNVGRFIGTPLQLYLMLENSLEYFTKNYARGNFSILGGNMLRIYKNFINKKYKMCYKKIQSEGLTFTLDEVKEHCNSCHKQWAKVLIFELDSAKFLNKIKNRPTVISCGIIKYQGGFLEFMHPTFGEYYSSKIFFSWMTNAKNFLSHKSKIEYLLENIFVRPAYQLVRNFLNFRLKKINIKLVPKKNLKQFGTVMSNVLKKRDKKITFMDVIMKEEQLGILDFVDAALKQNDENIWDFISHLGDPILIYACSLNATNVIQYLLDKIETMTKSEQYRILSTRGSSLETCLHQAAMCNNLIVVGLILERVEQISSQDQLYEFLSLKDSDNYTSLISGFAFVGKIIVDNAYGSSKETRGISFSTMPLILSDKPYFVAQKMFSTYLEFCLFDKNTAGSRAESFLSLFMNKNHDKNTMEVVKSILKKTPKR